MGKWELDIYTETRSYSPPPPNTLQFELNAPLSVSPCLHLFLFPLSVFTHTPLTHSLLYMVHLVWKVLCLGPWIRKAHWDIFLKQSFIIKIISNSNSLCSQYVSSCCLALLSRQKLPLTWHALLSQGPALYMDPLSFYLSASTLYPHPPLTMPNLPISPLHLHLAHFSSSQPICLLFNVLRFCLFFLFMQWPNPHPPLPTHPPVSLYAIQRIFLA